MSRSVGIDIGSFSIKVAVVNQRNKQYWFEEFHEFLLKPTPDADNEIEIIDILRQIGEKYDDGETKFVLGLPQSSVSSRICSFPFKERHKILKSVAFELEDDVPFTSEHAIFDAKITRFFKNTTEVLAYAVPKEAIKKNIQLSKDSRLPLESLSVEGLAFANLFENWQQAPQDAKDSYNPHEELEEDEGEEAVEWEPTDFDMVLHIGHSQTIVLFLDGNRLIDTRSLDWGGKDLSHALSEKYKIQASEANKELISKSFILLNNDDGNNNQAIYSDTLKASIDELHQQIQLLVIATESKFKLKLNNIFIVGGVSRIKNIGAYLTQKLERPVNRLKEFRMTPFVELEAGAKFGVNGGPAIGLAMEAFKKPINPASNVLKDEFAQKSEQWQMFWNKWGTTLKYVAAMFVLILTYGIIRDSISMNMKNLSQTALKKHGQKIAGLAKSKANSRNIKKFIKNQKGELKAIEMAEKIQGIGSSLDILKKLSTGIPGKNNIKLNVKALNIVNGYFDIQGDVATRSQLKQVEASLKGISNNGKIKQLKSTLRSTRGRIPFYYRVNLNVEGGV